MVEFQYLKIECHNEKFLKADVICMDYQYDIDQIAHTNLQINCFNADTFIEENCQALLSLAQKYHDIETLDKNRHTQICMFAPAIEDFDSYIVCTIFNDICSSNRRFHQFLRFQKYDKSQPIFVSYPELFEQMSPYGKDEYLPVKAFRYAGLQMSKDDEEFLGFEYGEHFFDLPFISEGLIEYLLRTYNDFGIHISPHHIYEKATSKEYIQRGMIKPIDPKCINRFILQKGFTGGYYDFSYVNPKFANNEIYWRSFRVSPAFEHSQGLDVVVNSRNNDMSMMLEELTMYENYMVGYCVHLDILDAIGKDLTKLQINHIDLAINIYEKQDIYARLKNRLCDGQKVANASYRTHLVRLENIPFGDIIKIISMFMKTHCLVMDWIDDQFPGYLQY